MKKLLLGILFLPLSLMAQDKDTIVTMSDVIVCQPYSLENGHLRYYQKGVGKWISDGDILTCSSPWRHWIDSINNASYIVSKIPRQLRRFMQNACDDTAKTCNIMAIEMGKLTIWNVTLFKVFYNSATKAEAGALLMSLDYGQINSAVLLIPAQLDVRDNDQAVILNSMVSALKFMISKGWIFVSCSENLEAGGERVYHYTLTRK